MRVKVRFGVKLGLGIELATGLWIRYNRFRIRDRVGDRLQRALQAALDIK